MRDRKSIAGILALAAFTGIGVGQNDLVAAHSPSVEQIFADNIASTGQLPALPSDSISLQETALWQTEMDPLELPSVELPSLAAAFILELECGETLECAGESSEAAGSDHHHLDENPIPLPPTGSPIPPEVRSDSVPPVTTGTPESTLTESTPAESLLTENMPPAAADTVTPVEFSPFSPSVTELAIPSLFEASMPEIPSLLEPLAMLEVESLTGNALPPIPTVAAVFGDIPPIPASPGVQDPSTDAPVDSDSDSLFVKRFDELNRPLSRIHVGYPGDNGPMPQNLAAKDAPEAPRQLLWGGDGWVESRPNRYPVVFTYQPLYYEELNLERCGEGHGYLQPLFSSAAFVKNTITLPYQLVVSPPRSEVVTPGDCPSCYRFPHSAK